MYIILTIICVHEYEILILIHDIFFTELESVTTTEVVDTTSESVYLTYTSVIEKVGEETTLLDGLEEEEEDIEETTDKSRSKRSLAELMERCCKHGCRLQKLSRWC